MEPGEYRVRVSASGYEIFEGTVRHGTEPTRYRVELVSFLQSFTDRLGSGGNGPEMMVIPPGRFLMGCVSGMNCRSDEKPIHEVSIVQSFALSKFEVTFAQWDTCVVDGGCNGYRPDDLGWERGSRPVVRVSWEDAQTYVSWLSRSTGENYRLPSESEWEYAARAGSTTQYNWGNDISRNRANCNGCGSQWNRQTAPVGSFTANAFGLHDMHGNVFEWVQDCGNLSYAGAPTDGSAWVHGNCDIRVLRGGSWSGSSRPLRAAYRFGLTADYRSFEFGFRVARTLTP
ncbi:MAG: formylglycine-generating enzyme family protein [Gammaproteobacteria bacterium]|nr:formylglycine-generating enzyme family protein [Gammaproteobacteria bacterium]